MTRLKGELCMARHEAHEAALAAGHSPAPWALKYNSVCSANGANVSGIVPSRMTAADLALVVAAPDLLTIARNAAYGPAEGESYDAFAIRLQAMAEPVVARALGRA